MLFLFVRFPKPHTRAAGARPLATSSMSTWLSSSSGIALGGVLRNPEGRRIGYTAGIEAEDLTGVTGLSAAKSVSTKRPLRGREGREVQSGTRLC
jgi:hypothetical protein